MILRTALSTLLAGAALASPAGAQEAGSIPGRGATSVMLGVSPGNGIGVWTMLSDRTALGVVGALQTLDASSGGSEQEFRAVVLGPQVKRYWATAGDVAPYLHGSAYTSLTRSRFTAGDGGGSGFESEQDLYGGSAAAGLDWFPTRRISLGGHAGVALNRYSGENRDASGQLVEQSRWLLETFTAAISVHLYL